VLYNQRLTRTLITKEIVRFKNEHASILIIFLRVLITRKEKQFSGLNDSLTKQQGNEKLCNVVVLNAVLIGSFFFIKQLNEITNQTLFEKNKRKQTLFIIEQLIMS